MSDSVPPAHAAEGEPHPADAIATPAPTTPPPMDRATLVAAALVGGLGVFVFYSGVLFLLASTMPERLRTALALAQVAGLLLPSLAVLAGARLLRILPAPRPRRTPRAGAALGAALWTSGLALLAMGLTTSFLALLSRRLLEMLMRFGMEMYEPLFRLGSVRDVWGILLVVTLVPAACEELLFRGYIQRMLRGAASPAVAIGVTAFLFALVHLEPIGFLSRTILGVGLGIAYERTGSLRLPMFGHALHNLVTVLLFPWEGEPVIPLPHEAAIGVAALLPGCAIAGFLWWRALNALPRSAP